MNIQVSLISSMNFDYKGNGRKKKIFMQIQSINIMYSNVENMIVVLNYKKNGDYYENRSLTFLMDNL